MSQQKTNFIKVASESQTMPVKPENRFAESDIRIEFCNETDCPQIAEALYACFPAIFWDRKEPPSLRPSDSIRIQRMAKRLQPTFSHAGIKWIKAVLMPSNQIIGVACWTVPGNPIHSHFRRSAVDFYSWKEKMGWTDAEIDEMWSNVSDEEWNGTIAKDDDSRRKSLGDEPHWYLAPLFTWPEYQGRGVGKKLLQWAIEQADATEPFTPMYLESAPTARAVYMHCGFVPQGGANFLRRGPAIVKEDEEMLASEPEEIVVKGNLNEASIMTVAKGMENNVV
ncbi:acyl-CoA N-acyltransferase [Phaeosphaeriaceae sp. PMI808]|nr:acyl-CoA N-acyltransferase [Phaeosphaeriaceae sp. PMI808]